MPTFLKILIAFFIFSLGLYNSQTFTKKDLVKIWSINDKTQTQESLKTYEDLINYYNPKKFNELISEIENSDEIKNNLRLQVRSILYEANGEVLINQKLSPELKTQLRDCIKSALILNDEQLLSEIYSLYFEQGFGDPDEKLYYISKTVETQEKIGAQYFPKLFFRYYNLSLGYYRSQDYIGSIQKGSKGLKHIKNPKENLDYYIFLLDILGASFYEIGKVEKSLEYYSLIKKTLDDYKINSSTYKGRFSKYDQQFVEIWNGIADGGIARIMIQKKDFEKATQLLEQNLFSSEKYKLESDLAKVYNLFGDIQFQQNNPSKALDFYKKSLVYSSENEYSKENVKSLHAISDCYRDLKQFENAYLYNVKFYQKKAEIEKQISNRKYSSISEKLNHENLKNSIEEAEATIKKQKTKRNINFLVFAIIILAFGVLGAIAYFRQKLRFSISENKRLNAEIELEESKKEAEIAGIQLEQFRKKLTQNNKIIEAFEGEIQQEDSSRINQLKETTILTNEDWNEFKKQFDKVYPNFLTNLRQHHSELTPAELRYLCLLRLELSTSEIASALGISPASLRVTKHRIRKKIGEKNQNFPISLLQTQE